MGYHMTPKSLTQSAEGTYTSKMLPPFIKVRSWEALRPLLTTYIYLILSKLSYQRYAKFEDKIVSD